MNANQNIELGRCQNFTAQDKLLDKDGKSVDLRAQSLAVLRLLASKPNEVVSKETIFSEIWKGVSVTDDSLVQCVSEIRRVIDDSNHKILITLPRRGYQLAVNTADQSLSVQANHQSQKSTRPSTLITWMGVLSAVLIVGIVWYNTSSYPPESIVTNKPDMQQAAVVESLPSSDFPTLAITVTQKRAQNTLLHALSQELLVAFGRYRSIMLVEGSPATYQITLDSHNLDEQAGDRQVTLLLKDRKNSSILLAESYHLTADNNAAQKLAIRVVATIASPGVGVIGQHLLLSSRLKPVEDLTPAECYA